MHSITKILVGTDFSEVSALAVQAAYALARRLGAELVVLHVVERPSFVLAGDLGYGSPGTMDAYLAAMTHKLTELEESLPNEGVAIHLRVGQGKPHQVIADVAQAEHAQLVVLGQVGRSGLSHLFLGSVSERTLRTSDVPVLVVRKSAQEGGNAWVNTAHLTRVLVPFDFSEHAERAVHLAAQLARLSNARVRLLYVFDSKSTLLPEHSSTAHGASLAHVREELQKLLDGECERLARACGVPLEAELKEGVPNHEITQRASSGDYDLVVMGTHGRAGLSRALLGSAAERVFREAPCPVVAVPLRDA